VEPPSLCISGIENRSILIYSLLLSSKTRKFEEKFPESLINAILRDETGQFTLVINGVRFTFLHFPYKVDFSESLDDIIKLPDLLTLAAMKAFALGRRAKWKDYVDLYFVLKANHSVAEITEKGVEIFGSEFNEKIFRTQLAYFKDIDYSEQVVYKDGFSTSDETIKKALVDFSLEQEAEYK